ncbi:SGNH/GDSL hydrolase family protein [Candidatus Merdisoma sp. JLR.KK006]|uniref:SGNH/GDSL hydrolase family protein n=1 Tax=Candidatus Merdisoma sp. JLR.KK006 TaxID=3112626 RepID=UPI002FF00658
MRRLLLGILILGLLTGKNENQAFQNGETVGFMGDSITHAEYSEINYTHVLYNYYVTHMPEVEIELRNLGVGGATVLNGIELYKKDPAAAGLDRVVLEYGINGLKRNLYENTEIYEESREEREENLEEYRENLAVFLKMLEEDGIKCDEIYTTTLAVPCNKYQEDAGDSDELQSLVQKGYQSVSDITREVAEEQQVGLIEFQEPLTELAETLSEREPKGSIMQQDLLHVNTDGQIYLAYLFLQQQGALRDVSSVEFEKGKIYSEDAHVSNLHYKDGYIYYDYRSERLPMGVSDEYYEADASLDILDKLNREIIQVQDLQADAVYDIYINGERIGSYSGKEFAEGVNIANVRENPAQRFAAVVEQMNRGRRAAELAYRKKVQDFTDCGSGEVTEDELLKAYEIWKEEDTTYRKNMYELVSEEIQVTERIAIVQQGVEAPEAAFRIPGRNYKKAAAAVLAVGAVLGSLFYYWRKKKKQ